MATFAQLGLAQGIVKFLPSFPINTQKRKEYLGFTVLMAILGYLILLCITYFFRPEIESYYAVKSPLFIQYFQISIIITLFLVFIQMSEAYSRSLLKSVTPIFIRDVLLRIMTTAIVLLLGFDLISFNLFIQLFVVLYAIVLLAHIIHFVHLKSLKLNFGFKEFKKPDAQAVMKYGFFTLIGASGTQIVLQIDSLMVAGIEGLDATGIYVIAFFIGTIIEIPRRSITQITTPLISQAFAKNDMKEVAQYYKQTSINQLVIGALLWIGVWANLDSIYNLMPSSEVYQAGFNVVLLIGLGKLTDMLFGVNGEIIVMSKYFKFNVFTVAFLAIAIIAGNSILIPKYGIDGAALASLIAMLLFNLIKFLFVYHKFGIQPFTFNTLKFLGIVGVVILVNLTLPTILNVYLDVIMRSTIITVLLISSTYYLKISPEINSLLNQLIKKVIKTD